MYKLKGIPQISIVSTTNQKKQYSALCASLQNLDDKNIFLSRYINTRLQHLTVNYRCCFHFSDKWHKHITHRISHRNIPTDDLLCVAKPIPQNITEELRLLTKFIDKFSTKSLQPSDVYLFSFEQQQVDKLWETL